MATHRYEYQSDFARKYYYEGMAEGRAEGKAEALLQILRNRGFVIDDATQARAATCHDVAQLDAWFGRVLSATTLDEVFAAPE